MNRRTHGSMAALMALSLAGCSSTDGPTITRSFSSPNQTAMYSPQPQPPLNPQSSLGAAAPSARNARVTPPAKKSSQQRLARRPEPILKRTTIVVDVDDTLCTTDYNCVLWGIGSDGSEPLMNAARVLRELATKYDILYLTARPASTSHRTERWLKKYNFPSGPIMGSKNIIDFLGQTSFKKKTLAKLRRERSGTLIGIGDRPRDAEAYRTNQMVPVVVNPCRGGKFHRDDLLFRDWNSVARFFEANERLFLDPLELAEDIRKGELRVAMPG